MSRMADENDRPNRRDGDGDRQYWLEQAFEVALKLADHCGHNDPDDDPDDDGSGVYRLDD